MKKIILAQLGKPSRQWQVWIDALAESEDFEINAVHLLSMELQKIHADPGDVVLFDGMLPNLSRFIQRTRAQSPDAHIIVATDVESFVIRYEIMHVHEIIFFSGPLGADQFLEALRSVAFQGRHFAA